MHEILDRTTATPTLTVTRVLDGAEILEMRDVARGADRAAGPGLRDPLTLATHPELDRSDAAVKRTSATAPARAAPRR